MFMVHEACFSQIMDYFSDKNLCLVIICILLMTKFGMSENLEQLENGDDTREFCQKIVFFKYVTKFYSMQEFSVTKSKPFFAKLCVTTEFVENDATLFFCISISVSLKFRIQF